MKENSWNRAEVGTSTRKKNPKNWNRLGCEEVLKLVGGEVVGITSYQTLVRKSEPRLIVALIVRLSYYLKIYRNFLLNQ